MKAKVYSSSFKVSKRFERMVVKLLPKDVKKIYISGVCMQRASGYGHYHFITTIDCKTETGRLSQPIALK